MKTFEDLDFLPHEICDCFDGHARMQFENGYGVSVIYGECAYGDPAHPYELAVLKDGQLCYDSPITNDVVGHLDKQGVTEIMKAIQEL